MKTMPLTVAILSAAALTTPLAAQQATFPTGRFTMVMRDATSELQHATIEFTKDWHYIVTHEGHVMFMGTYQLDGDRITVSGRVDTPCNDANGDPIPGVYTWLVRDGVLDFTQLDDRCNARRDEVMIALFYPEGTAP
jgi:hypothetical protein